MRWGRDVTPSSGLLAAPNHFTHPEWSVSLGPEVAEVAAMAGLPPYPEQALLLDELFAVDPLVPSRSAAFEVGLVCARQQLKTGLLKLAALGWLFVDPQDLVIWSAHEFGTAQEAFRDMQALIAAAPELSSRVARIRTSPVEEIETRDGARLRFKARTSGGGRGLTGSKVILDEAYALEPGMLGALLPTLISVGDPQVVYASSAGQARSVALRAVRDRGRRGARRLAYAEWCAPRVACDLVTCRHDPGTPGCALDRVDLWREACVVTARRDPENMEVIAGLRAALPPAQFMRECLGWWDEPTGDAPIPEAVWSGMADPGSGIVSEPTVVLEVTPERDWACVVAAGGSADGRVHVEITSNSVTGDWDHRPGVDWVVPRLAGMGRRVWVAAGSAAESVVPDLERAGVLVDRVPAASVPAACGRFYDLAVSGGLAHPEQSDLAAAVVSARQKWLGDKAFTWVRPDGAGDLTPLYAATLAVWVAEGAGSVYESRGMVVL